MLVVLLLYRPRQVMLGVGLINCKVFKEQTQWISFIFLHTRNNGEKYAKM